MEREITYADADLGKGEIHIWCVILPLIKTHLKRYLQHLSNDEQAKAHRFISSEPREQYIYARYILRCILSKYTAQAPESIPFAYTTYGKPYIGNTTDIQFNLSHSKRCIVYAITREIGVGIDVAFLDVIDFAQIGKRFFAPSEYVQLMETTPAHRKNFFYKIWTCKEAFVKHLGMGLSYPLQDFAIAIAPDHQKAELISVKNNDRDIKNYAFHIFSPYGGYVATLVSEKPMGGIYTRWLSKVD